MIEEKDVSERVKNDFLPERNRTAKRIGFFLISERRMAVTQQIRLFILA